MMARVRLRCADCLELRSALSQPSPPASAFGERLAQEWDCAAVRRHVSVSNPGCHAPAIMSLDRVHSNGMIAIGVRRLVCAGWKPAIVARRLPLPDLADAAERHGLPVIEPRGPWTLSDGLVHLRNGHSLVTVYSSEPEQRPWRSLAAVAGVPFVEVGFAALPLYPGIDEVLLCRPRLRVVLRPEPGRDDPAHPSPINDRRRRGPVAPGPESFSWFAAIVVSVTGGAIDDLRPGARLVEDLGLDSLDLTELALALESKVGIQVPDARVLGGLTAGDLHKLFALLLAESRGTGTDRPVAELDGQSWT